MHPLVHCLIQVSMLSRFHQQLFRLSFELLVAVLTLRPKSMLRRSNALTHCDIGVGGVGGGGMFARINSEHGSAFMLPFIATCLRW